MEGRRRAVSLSLCVFSIGRFIGERLIFMTLGTQVSSELFDDRPFIDVLLVGGEALVVN